VNEGDTVNARELERQLDKVFSDLVRDLGDNAAADQVTTIGHDHYERLRRDATVNDFIPLLVYRFTREELVRSRRDELHDAA
jgi:hypothetical protein